MTEQEFRAAVLDVFPSHIGIRVWLVRKGTGWDTRVGEQGESFFVQWHGNAWRGYRWRVRSGRLVGKSASLREAVVLLQASLSGEASKIANQQNAIECAQKAEV